MGGQSVEMSDDEMDVWLAERGKVYGHGDGIEVGTGLTVYRVPEGLVVFESGWVPLGGGAYDIVWGNRWRLAGKVAPNWDW